MKASGYLSCGVAVYAWALLLVVGVLLLQGCVDGPGPLPLEATCAAYRADMDQPAGSVPSLERAPFGVRIVVAPDFQDFAAVAWPLPTGTLVMEPWIYHWFDGDHLGAIGRGAEPGDCRWYVPIQGHDL